MQQVTIYDWRVEVDPEATRAAYELFDAIDPRCCNACTAFLQAVRRQSFPTSLTSFLTQAGAVAEKAQEVWGAPDGGFLGGWWVVVGRLLDGPWGGGSEGAFAEPVPGLKCWITDTPSMLPAPGLMEGQGILQVEFAWSDKDLAELAAGWNGRSAPKSAT